VFVVGCLGNWTAAAEVLALKEGLRRYIEAQSKKGKNSAPDAEGGARGGGIFTSHGVAPCPETTSNDYSRADGFTMVAQPTEVQPTAGTLGNRGLRSHTELDGHGAYIPVAFSQNQREEVREVEVPGALAAEPGTHQQTYIAQPVPYDLFQITAPVNRQNRKPGDPCHTLARDNAAHAAVAFANRTRDGIKVPEVMADGVSPALTNPGNGGRSDAINVAVAFTVDMQACKGNANVGDGSVSPTLCKPSGNDVHALAIGTDCYNGAITGDVAATMGTPGSSAGASEPTVMQAVAVAPSLTATNDPSRSPQSAEVTQQVAAVHASTMTVRRLTPVECERLQGFPDNWTLIPWRKKPAEDCPDGPRYKALGNSMACNCMAWIGERIAAWEAAQ